MKATDKLGYIVLLSCIVYLFYQIGGYFFYELVCLTIGVEEKMLVISKENVDNKKVYTLTRVSKTNENSSFVTLPMNKDIPLGQQVNARLVPFFNVALLGKIRLLPFSLSLAVLLLVAVLFKITLTKLFYSKTA